MAIASFYADKLEKMLEVSESFPQIRRPNMAQRYAISMMRPDVPAERVAKLSRNGKRDFSFDIADDEFDASKIGAGIWLVGDSGVYCMVNVSREAHQQMSEPIEYVSQSFETDPRNFEFDDRYDAKVRIFGGDDGCDFIDADMVREACRIAREVRPDAPIVTLNITRNGISLPTAEAAATYLDKMDRKVTLFSDPDSKNVTPDQDHTPSL